MIEKQPKTRLHLVPVQLVPTGFSRFTSGLSTSDTDLG